MRTLLKLLMIAAVGAACATVASAALITFVGVNGVDDGIHYVGPYTITVDGVVYQTMCYDYADYVNTGQTWTAHLYTLNDLSSAYFSNQGDYQDTYAEVAWLFSNLLETTDPATMIFIQHAAWAMFSPGLFMEEQGSSLWMAAAQNAQLEQFPGLDLSQFRVVESIGEPRVQGLIITGFVNRVAAPEPAEYALTGVGLIAFTALARARRRRFSA